MDTVDRLVYYTFCCDTESYDEVSVNSTWIIFRGRCVSQVLCKNKQIKENKQRVKKLPVSKKRPRKTFRKPGELSLNATLKMQECLSLSKKIIISRCSLYSQCLKSFSMVLYNIMFYRCPATFQTDSCLILILEL